MRPLLGELAAPVDHIIEDRFLVWAQPRERHLIVRARQHVDGVDLHQAKLADHAPNVARRYVARSPPVKSLRRERHAARLTERESASGHRQPQMMILELPALGVSAPLR